jgi:hypothetical protein
MSTPTVTPADADLLNRSRTENTILLLDNQIAFYTKRALANNVEGQYNEDWATVKSIESFKETMLRTDKRINESAMKNAEFGIPAVMVIAFIAFFVGLVAGGIVF